MPPKRKRQEDTEEGEDVTPVKKATKSKKEQLKEARARARQWAEEEAAKKKPASTAAAAAPSSSSKAATAKKNPSRKSVTTPKKPAVSKSASKPAAASSPMRATTTTKGSSSTKKQPATSSNTKLAKERKVAEARARARAWASEQEAKKLSSRSATKSAAVEPKRRARPVKQEEDIEDDDEDDEDDLMENEEDEEELQESDEEVEDTDMEDGKEEEQEEEQVVYKYQQPPGRAKAPRAPFSSPGRPIATKKRTTTSMKMEAMSPVALSGHLEAMPPIALSVRKQLQVEQDREMQEKLELQRQIQAQVMNNAVASLQDPDGAATKRHSLTQQDVVNFMQQQQQPAQYQYTQPEYDTKRRRPFLLCVSILAALGTIAWAFISGTLANSVDMIHSTLTSSVSTVSSNALPACFNDNVVLPEDVEPRASPFECDDTLSLQHCPEAGSCVNGHLFSCESKHLEIASDGSRCVLNEASNITLADMEVLLSNWTTQCYCDFNGVDFALKSESGAGFVFPISKVTEQIDVDEKLVSLSNDYEISSMEDGEVLVGLSDDYVDTKLDLPVLCWVSLVTIDTFRSAVGVVVYGLLHATSVIFGVTFAYPLASLVCLAILLFIQYTRNRKEASKNLAIDVASVRQMAYQRMMMDSLEHIVLHLRDGIAMDLHPTNKKSRSYIILRVWPRVVADVRHDNRVKKTNRLVGSKPRDVWQWVANPSSSNKKDN